MAGMVLNIDSFGNVITNFDWNVSWNCDLAVQIRVGRRVIDTFYSNYSAAPAGRCFAMRGSAGYVEVSINQSNAAESLRIEPGAVVELEWLRASGSTGILIVLVRLSISKYWLLFHHVLALKISIEYRRMAVVMKIKLTVIGVALALGISLQAGTTFDYTLGATITESATSAIPNQSIGGISTTLVTDVWANYDNTGVHSCQTEYYRRNNHLSH